MRATSAGGWPSPANPCIQLPSTGCTPLGAGELSGENIEVAVVSDDRKFRVLTPAEVQDYLQEVE